jgi:hypothetical protein
VVGWGEGERGGRAHKAGDIADQHHASDHEGDGDELLLGRLGRDVAVAHRGDCKGQRQQRQGVSSKRLGEAGLLLL